MPAYFGARRLLFMSGRLSPSEKIALLLGPDRLSHWDATDARSITLSGAAVTGLRNLVSNTIYAPGVASTRPAYSADGFSGGPCILFDGVDDYLLANESLGATGSNGGELWVLVNQTAAAAATGVRYAIATGNTSVTQARVAGRNVVSGVNRGTAGAGNGSSLVSTVTAAVDLSGYHVIRTIVTSTTVAASVDGAAPTSTAVTPNTSTGRTTLGATPNAGANYWQGSISCALITAPLSTEKASALVALLQERYT